MVPCYLSFFPLSLLLPCFPATAPVTFPHLQYLYPALVLSRTCSPLIVPFLLSWFLCLLQVIYFYLKNLELGSTNETEYLAFVCLALSLLPQCNNSRSSVTVAPLCLGTAFGSCSYLNLEAPCTQECQEGLAYKLLKVRQGVLFISTQGLKQHIIEQDSK